jgi:putative membrane protein
VILALSSGVAWTGGRLFGWHVPLTITPFTLLGVSLAIFLGFRNSASYDRYWEGRKLWGSLLNVTRSLVRQAMSLTGLEAGDPRLLEWTALLCAFAPSLRHQLRQTDPAADLARLLGEPRQHEIGGARYRPAMILGLLGGWIRARRGEELCGEITAAAFDENVGELTDVLGGCERLASTPLPYPYALMIHRTVYIYCFLLPFGLVDTIGAMTPVISVLVAYTFMALEALADELEEPFGTSPNDLALTALSQGIEDSLLEMTGQPLRHAPPTPQEYVLQ